MRRARCPRTAKTHGGSLQAEPGHSVITRGGRSSRGAARRIQGPPTQPHHGTTYLSSWLRGRALNTAGAAGSTRGVRTWAQWRQRRWPWLQMRAAPVAALCRWPGRAGGREGRGSLRYDHGGHPDAVAGAPAPHPPPAYQRQQQGVRAFLSQRQWIRSS